MIKRSILFIVLLRTITPNMALSSFLNDVRTSNVSIPKAIRTIQKIGNFAEKLNGKLQTFMPLLRDVQEQSASASSPFASFASSPLSALASSLLSSSPFASPSSFSSPSPPSPSSQYAQSRSGVYSDWLGYGDGYEMSSKSDYGWLVPIVVVIGLGTLVIPLLGTFMTSMLTQGTINLTAGRRRRSASKPQDYSPWKLEDILQTVDQAIDKFSKQLNL